jgi:hypothetical protein
LLGSSGSCGVFGLRATKETFSIGEENTSELKTTPVGRWHLEPISKMHGEVFKNLNAG